jgi:hypothetical protein
MISRLAIERLLTIRRLGDPAIQMANCQLRIRNHRIAQLAIAKQSLILAITKS